MEILVAYRTHASGVEYEQSVWQKCEELPARRHCRDLDVNLDKWERPLL
jgi:hypothetical protein